MCIRDSLKPAATHSGSLDENELAANVETKPELITRAEKIPFEIIKKENPNLPTGQEKIITPGVEGERTHYISVLTENGKQTETVLDSQVTKEPVTQVVEIGAPITHKGDEHGLAPVSYTHLLRARLDTTSKRSAFTANSVGSKTKRAVSIIDVKLEVMANPADVYKRQPLLPLY